MMFTTLLPLMVAFQAVMPDSVVANEYFEYMDASEEDLEEADIELINPHSVDELQFPSLNMPFNISHHRPNVYINGFPTISIDMDEPIEWNGSRESLQFIRDNWYDATLNVHNTGVKFEMDDVRVTVRGRGNSTWIGMGYKRPIRFRFPNDEWRAMFDSPHVGRDWVTFANAMDPSHLRNFSAYYLGDILGTFNFTPQTWFTHLYLDGDYRGVYMLLDEREAIEGRGDLNLDEDPTISEYMIEYDTRTARSEDPVNSHWVDVRGAWDIRYPSTSDWMAEANNPHALYVEDYLTRIDNALLKDDRDTIESMLDIASFVDFYIVQEFIKNNDSQLSSLFFQIRGEGVSRRLYAGPLWDFDLSSGSISADGGSWEWELYGEIESPIGERAAHKPHSDVRFDWFYLLLNKPWFREEVRNRWLEVRDNEVVRMMNRVRYMAINFEDEFQRDLDRWPDHGDHAWNSAEVSSLDTFMEQAEYLHWWFTQRVEWMNDWLEVPTSNGEVMYKKLIILNLLH